MVIDYIKLHDELFNKIYIHHTATEKDRKMNDKLCEWVAYSMEKYSMEDYDE